MSHEKHWTTLRDLDVSERRKPKELLAKTPGQRRYIDAVRNHQLTICIGPAGTGKSYLAVGIAVQDLLAGKYEKLILARPMVECGRKLGAMPGEKEDKLAPYLEAIMEVLGDFMPESEIRKMVYDKKIICDTLETMRGKTFKKAFVILDEAQNTDKGQMMMFLTRVGEGSKVVVNGDTSGHQNDLSYNQESGLDRAWACLNHPEIGKVKLTRDDVVRSGLVKIILEQWEQYDDREYLEPISYGSYPR